jgi:hypothetical protein
VRFDSDRVLRLVNSIGIAIPSLRPPKLTRRLESGAFIKLLQLTDPADNHSPYAAFWALTFDVLRDPAPFVVQTALNDFYVGHELNALYDPSEEYAEHILGAAPEHTRQVQ